MQSKSAAGVTHITHSQFDFFYEPRYNRTMKKKRTPEQREAMKFAYWNKWGGGDPNKVIRTKGITKDEWYIQDITKPCDESHIKSI